MDLDALAESARNRGLKLVRSRIRTPGKGDFGKVGLQDNAGKPLFGIKGKALTATPEEVRDYLRKLEVADWGASLDAPVPKRRAAPKPSNDDAPLPKAAASKAPAAKAPPKPKSAPKPKPPPKPEVRFATVRDAAAILPLVRALGYSLEQRAFAKRLQSMIEAGTAPLVALLGKELIGLCGIQVSTMLQRAKPVGRITILVVAEDHRGKSIGRMLVEAAVDHFRSAGCELVEVTSNDRHLAAHAFYRRMGFERTSIRFARTL